MSPESSELKPWLATPGRIYPLSDKGPVDNLLTGLMLAGTVKT